jgi:hypothetical protein
MDMSFLLNSDEPVTPAAAPAAPAPVGEPSTPDAAPP